MRTATPDAIRLTTTVLLLLMFVLSGCAQEPPSPYPLSHGVQVRAIALNVWRQVAQDPSQAIRYFDTLTASDIIGTERARLRSGTPTVEDYDVGFASICVFVPNKPQTGFLEQNSVRVRQALDGMYLSERKRDAFTRAVNPVVLRVTREELFSMLGGITNPTNYDRRVIDVAKLR